MARLGGVGGGACVAVGAGAEAGDKIDARGGMCVCVGGGAVVGEDACWVEEAASSAEWGEERVLTQGDYLLAAKARRRQRQALGRDAVGVTCTLARYSAVSVAIVHSSAEDGAQPASQPPRPTQPRPAPPQPHPT